MFAYRDRSLKYRTSCIAINNKLKNTYISYNKCHDNDTQLLFVIRENMVFMLFTISCNRLSSNPANISSTD